YTTLSKQRNQDYRRIASNNGDDKCRVQESISSRCESCSNRFGVTGKNFVIIQSCHDIGKQYIKDRTDDQRTDYTYWHPFFGIFCFLSSSTYGIKSYKCKEQYSCSP